MRKKLFLSTLAVVLLTLILSMLAVNYVFKSQFSDYLTKSTEAYLEQLPNSLSTIYESTGRWDNASLLELSHSLPSGTEVLLQDPSGNTIADLVNPMDSMMYRGMGGMGGMGGMMGINSNPPYSVQEWKTKTLKVKGTENNTLAIAQVRYPASARILNPQDVSFVSAVFRSLLFAGTLALIIAALLIFFISRRLVRPLQRLTEATYRLGQGNLKERVNIATKDEVGQLAHAFNSMADNLTRQENLRKQFAADIAHELRTPLTSIRSYIEAFQDGVLPANEENLTSINEEIERLVGIASDLKDLNIAEIGALKLNIQPVNLCSLVSKVIHNLHPLIQEKEIILDWQEPPQSIFIQGDDRLLTRLFYNLLHNAYKYTQAGGQITVSLTEQSDKVLVELKDTGIGIAEADLPFVFERFYRTDKSRTRETGGSGIGLALVKQIAALHHGHIDVTSKVGLGSTFMVELPKRQELKQ